MRISINTFFDGRQQEPMPDFVAGVARAMEERGFAGVWMAEHLVAFDRYDPAFPYPYTDEDSVPEVMSTIAMLEPMVALGAMAMHTKTLRLGTGVIILPQRNPVYFAKEGATVDLLSNGRFIAGLGIGWSGQEFAATGTPFEHRGSRMHEYLQVVRSLWTEERPHFEGRFYNLPECIQNPKPVQRPHPPFYFGGDSPPALRRVAEFGAGWFGLRLSPETLVPRLAQLNDSLAANGRSLAEIDIVVSPADLPCDERTLAAYAELGVAEVVMVCFGHSLDGFRRALDRMAKDFVEPARRL
jgi:probable F420-dependent oxidoreductase